MSYQKKNSYSSKKRTQKRNSYKKYDTSKSNNDVKSKKIVSSNNNGETSKKKVRVVRKNTKFNNTKNVVKRAKEFNKCLITSNVNRECFDTLWFTMKVDLTKFRKRLTKESALKLTKFIQKNAGLFITNMDNELHVKRLFDVKEVQKYIIKHWKYKKYSNYDKHNKLWFNMIDKDVYMNLNITEFFKDHIKFKTIKSGKSITRSMVIKTSMFDKSDEYYFKVVKTHLINHYIRIVDAIYIKSEQLSYDKIYVLFWNDKDLINLYQRPNITPFMDGLYSEFYGNFKVKCITTESNIRYHKKNKKSKED